MAQPTKQQMIQVKKMLADRNIDFQEFYSFLRDKEWGDWDNINGEEVMNQYLADMREKGVHISHIVAAMEKHPSSEELYDMWLGNSMLTPKPINSKQDLFKALFD